MKQKAQRPKKVRRIKATVVREALASLVVEVASGQELTATYEPTGTTRIELDNAVPGGFRVVPCQ